MSILKSTNSGKEKFILYKGDFQKRNFYFNKEGTEAFYRQIHTTYYNITTELERVEEEVPRLDGSRISMIKIRFVVNKAKLWFEKNGTLYMFPIISISDLDLVREFCDCASNKNKFEKLKDYIIDLIENK